MVFDVVHFVSGLLARESQDSGGISRRSIAHMDDVRLGEAMR